MIVNILIMNFINCFDSRYRYYFFMIVFIHICEYIYIQFCSENNCPERNVK